MKTGNATEAGANFNAAAKRSGWPSICDPTLSFGDAEFQPLMEIWQRAAAEGRLPSRREIDLKKLKCVLRDMAIYERVVNGTIRYRVRLMGTAFAEAMGDLSGKFIDEAVPPEYLPRWRAALDAAFEAGAPIRFIGQLDVASKDYLVAEYFEAPLLADDGSPTLVLAAGHFMARRWSEYVEQESKRLQPDLVPAL